MAIRRRRLQSGKPVYYVVVYNKHLDKTVYIGRYGKIADAKAAEAEAMRRIHATRPANAGLITMRELTDKWVSTRKMRDESMRAVTRDMGYVNEVFGDRRVADITAEDIERFAASLTVAPLSRARIMRRFLQVLRKGQAWGYTLLVPPVSIRDMVKAPKREREPRILTPEEARTIARAAPRRYYAMFVVWPLLGLRLNEMLALQVGDIDFDAGVVRVRHQLSRQKDAPLKTDASRRDVNMTDEVARVLADHIAQEQPRKYLWPSPNSQMPFSDGTWRNQVWEPTVEKADIGDFRSHDFRHSFGAWLVQAGASVQYVQRQMGHETPLTTLTAYNDLLNPQDDGFTRKMGEWYSETKTEHA